MSTKGNVTISKANLVAMAIGTVVVVVLIVMIVTGNVRRSTAVNEVGNSAPAASSPTTSPTHSAAPANVTVPDQGTKNVPANVAVPQGEAAAAPGVAAKLRIFSITETASAFTPDTVVVKPGDTVDISVTASGGNYDVTQPDYGLSLVVPNGATKELGFQALSAGKFTLYCKSCGGPDREPVGYVIVTGQ